MPVCPPGPARPCDPRNIGPIFMCGTGSNRQWVQLLIGGQERTPRVVLVTGVDANGKCAVGGQRPPGGGGGGIGVPQAPWWCSRGTCVQSPVRPLGVTSSPFPDGPTCIAKCTTAPPRTPAGPTCGYGTNTCSKGKTNIPCQTDADCPPRAGDRGMRRCCVPPRGGFSGGGGFPGGGVNPGGGVAPPSRTIFSAGYGSFGAM